MLAAILAVVIVAPFERPLFTLPGGFTATSVEVVTLAALAVLVVAHVRAAGRPRWPLPFGVTLAGALFLAALTVAAVSTAFAQANALRFVGRMVVAATLCVATIRAIDTAGRARAVAVVMLAVAAVVAAIGVLEAMQVTSVMTMLTAFRPGFHVVAGQLRATSTLVYPTIASMYLEVAFAVGLGLLLDRTPRRRRVERPLVFLGLVLIGAGISATFTRAGLLAMAAAIATVAGVRSCVPCAACRVRSCVAADLGLLGMLAAALVIVVSLAHSPERLAARVTTEGSGGWYGVSYAAPKTLTMRTAGLHRVPITVTNTGRLTWDSAGEPPFALSYHWLRANRDAVVVFGGQRSKFPHPVPPGQSVSLDADIFAPGEPGAYTLVWDVVHETRAWLSTEGVVPARTDVTVNGERAAPVATTMGQLPQAMRRPARPELWSAALRIAADHPLLGIGPDNYRLAYGRYLGTAHADPRVHANNMYLEVLTGAGVPGLGALFGVVAATGLALWRRLRDAPSEAHVCAAAAIALWVVITGHGLVDSFLGFTSTYVTFAIAAGWALSPGLVSGASDAHRL